MLRSPASAWRSAGRYAATGLATYVVDLGLLVLLREAASAPLPLATAAAYCGAVAVNFAVNSRWSFGAGAHRRGFARYLLLLVANLVATVLLVQALVLAGLPYPVAKTACTVAATLWTYPLSRYWVYRS